MATVLKKNDIMINPETQRTIRVGGVAWKKLVKRGIVDGNYLDPCVLAEIDENKDIDEQIDELNKTLPKNKQAVRGRHRLKNKIVQRVKPPDLGDISEYTAKIASKALKDNFENLAECDDLEKELEKLIMEEMAGTKKILKKPKELEYELKELDESDCDDCNDTGSVSKDTPTLNNCA